MKIIKLGVAFALFLTLTACASIAGENSRRVRVSSIPSGATIVVDNQNYGVTPAVISLPNYIYGGKSVTLKKRGYQDQTMMVNTQFQPIALLDIFLWPTFIVDAAAGNLVKIDPASVNLDAKLYRI